MTSSSWHWRLIRTPASTLTPRYQPAVAPINQNEIAIMGGWASEGYSRLGDVVLFDTRTKKCETVVSDQTNSTIKFNALANQSGRTKIDSMMALVSDQHHKPCLVEFQKGSPSVVSVIQSNCLSKQWREYISFAHTYSLFKIKNSNFCHERQRVLTNKRGSFSAQRSIYARMHATPRLSLNTFKYKTT